MALKETATQTLQILDAGYFLTLEGRRIDIQPALTKAIEGTKLYTPEQASATQQRLTPTSEHRATIEVTDETTQIAAALRRRAGFVLAVAADNGHRTILLGAWGCGVFRNDPALVADAFGTWLESPTFAGVFDRVVFAIYDKSATRSTLTAFKQRFPGVA